MKISSRYSALPYRQQGVVLFVAMIMLILLTMLAITGMNLGKSSLQTVGNMQHRNQVIAVAQQIVEEVLSTTRFFETPNAIFTNSCNGSANTQCMDIDEDNKPDITVALTPPPTCVRVKGLKNMALDLSQPQDLGCLVEGPQNFGMAGSTTGNSLCSDSVWELRAQSMDVLTSAQTVVTQGAAVRVANDNIITSCP